MQNKEILVVHYSRSGFTKKVAEELAQMLGCDVEEVKDKKAGRKGYFESLLEAMFKRNTSIMDLKNDPSKYALVIVGTPVWASSVCSPIRTYLSQNKNKFNHVAFFLTQGGSAGRKRVFAQMKDICGKDPLGVLAIRDTESVKGKDHEKVKDFLRGLSEMVALPPQVSEAVGH